MGILMELSELSRFFQTADEVYAEYKKRGECKFPVGMLLSSGADYSAFHKRMVYDGADSLVWYDQDYAKLLMHQAKEAIRYFWRISPNGWMAYSQQPMNMVYISVLRIEEKDLMVACASFEKELVMSLLVEICRRHNFISSAQEKNILISRVIYDTEKLYAIFQK